MAEIGRADDWGLSSAAFELPDANVSRASQAALADAELKLDLAVLKYARHARGGRVDPMQAGQNSDHKPALIAPKAVLQRHRQRREARQLLARPAPKAPPVPAAAASTHEAARRQAGRQSARAAMLPEGPNLRPGTTHPQIASVRRQLGVHSETGRDDFYDARLEAAVRMVQRQHQLRPDGVITSSTRAALNGDARNSPIPVKGGARGNASTEIQRIILNMERWRWMPSPTGRPLRVGQHPRVHNADREEGGAHPLDKDHRRQDR